MCRRPYCQPYSHVFMAHCSYLKTTITYITRCDARSSSALATIFAQVSMQERSYLCSWTDLRSCTLRQALMDEKASPELLEYQQEVMERLQTRLAAQVCHGTQAIGTPSTLRFYLRAA